MDKTSLSGSAEGLAHVNIDIILRISFTEKQIPRWGSLALGWVSLRLPTLLVYFWDFVTNLFFSFSLIIVSMSRSVVIASTIAATIEVLHAFLPTPREPNLPPHYATNPELPPILEDYPDDIHIEMADGGTFKDNFPRRDPLMATNSLRD